MATVAQQISYTDLYARWERGNWRATEIDFTEDRRQWWEEMTEFERKAALWNYALFFWGEDAVADGLSPYIDAAPHRGAEVLPRHPAGRRGAPRRLLRALHARGLRRRRRHRRGRPRGDQARADLGLPHGVRPARADVGRAAQRPLAAAPVRRDRALPRRDRGDARAARPALHHQLPARPRPAARLPRGHGPHRAGRAAPHRLRREAAVRHRGAEPGVPPRRRRPAARGAAVDRVRARAARAGTCATRRCSASSSRTSPRREPSRSRPRCAAPACRWTSCPGRRSSPTACPPSGASRTACGSCSGGVLGEKLGPPSSDPETVAALFDLLGASLDHTKAPPEPGTIQWDFPDAEPWHLVVANGDTRVEHGPRGRPDRHVPVPLRGLGRRVRRPRAPAAPRRAPAPAPERRLPLAVARAPHVPQVATEPAHRPLFGRKTQFRPPPRRK